MWRRGKANLVAGQVEPDHTSPRKLARLDREGDVVVDCVMAHGAYDRNRTQRPGGQSRKHCLDHLGHGQPVAQMQPRRPSHLEIVDVLRGRIDAQLEGDTLERRRCLQHGDRVVEVRDEGRLRRTIRRRHHPQGAREVQALGGG